MRDAFVLEGNGKVKELCPGVAIVADSTWAAMSARRQLKVTWDEGAVASQSWDGYVAEARAKAAQPGQRVLDVAGGTADLSRAFAKRVGQTGSVVLTDINAAMLGIGRDRLLDDGVLAPAVQCDAEKLPFVSNHFDCVCVAFGLRNMTHKETALAEMCRVLRAGGRLLVLEFSRVWKPLQGAYDAYSFNVLPKLGELTVKDAGSYRYLAESIRMHPDQETLKQMMTSAGLERVAYFNLAAGVVALHRGYKL